MEKVSIIVPVYNMGNKIDKCVSALMAQTYYNIEIILIDDGSKDDSFLKCQQLAEVDNRIKAFHTENRGSGPARNYGIEQATGRYIYFPDADDYLEPNAIEELEEQMRIGGYDLIVFGFKNVSSDGNVLKNIKEYPDMVQNGDEIRKQYSNYMTTVSKYGIQGAPWNKFFNLDLIRKHHILYPALRRHQDEGFIARYMNYVQTVCFSSKVYYTYFTNDLSKEWDKYPVTYIEAVQGLFEERKTNILIWNLEDEATHDLVYKEYICNVIKALELSFSPKFGLDKKQRKKWISEKIYETGILKITPPHFLGKYQNSILKLMNKNKINTLYFLLSLKVFAEKNGFLNLVK